MDYTAVTYRVSVVHAMTTAEEEAATGRLYREGTVVEVFGFEVYNSVE